MDLRHWSRAALLKEARRLGIADAEGLERDALMGAILRKWSERPRDAFNMARAAVGRVLRFGRRGRSPEPQRLPPTKRHAPSGANRDFDGSPRQTPPQRTASPQTRPSSTRDPDAPWADEPIRTRTMARLLAEQGHDRRALAIYDELLRTAPRDPVIRREADEVRARAKHGRNVRADGDEADDEWEREVVAVAVDSSRLLVSWAVAGPAVERAGRMLGGAGTLTARVVVVAPDADQVVRSETRERHDVDSSGQWVVDDLPPGARATASVGLLGNERFVSIGHTPTIFLRDATAPAGDR